MVTLHRRVALRRRMPCMGPHKKPGGDLSTTRRSVGRLEAETRLQFNNATGKTLLRHSEVRIFNLHTTASELEGSEIQLIEDVEHVHANVQLRLLTKEWKLGVLS